MNVHPLSPPWQRYTSDDGCCRHAIHRYHVTLALELGHDPALYRCCDASDFVAQFVGVLEAGRVARQEICVAFVLRADDLDPPPAHKEVAAVLQRHRLNQTPVELTFYSIGRPLMQARGTLRRHGNEFKFGIYSANYKLDATEVKVWPQS